MNRELLEKPFEKEQIKQRKGNFGDTIDYVEAHAVIQRLNDAFDGQWSFEVLSQENNGSQVMVLGKLTADGVSKTQFGCSSITTNSKTGEIVSLGDDWKAATSDALKKSASLFGIGLHLYGADKSQPSEHTGKDSGKGMSEKSKPKGGTTITKEQLAQIKKLRTDLGWTPEKVQEQSKTMFGTDKVENLNPTMATALIAYLQNQGNGKGADY
jgi:recombination DNA repair RAD52 pathway protein